MNIEYLGCITLAFGSNERETTPKHFHNYFCIPFSMNTLLEYNNEAHQTKSRFLPPKIGPTKHFYLTCYLTGFMK